MNNPQTDSLITRMDALEAENDELRDQLIRVQAERDAVVVKFKELGYDVEFNSQRIPEKSAVV